MFMVWHPGVRCAEFSEIVVVSGPAGAPHEPVASDDELVNRFQTATTGIVIVRFWRPPADDCGVTFFGLSPEDQDHLAYRQDGVLAPASHASRRERALCTTSSRGVRAFGSVESTLSAPSIRFPDAEVTWARGLFFCRREKFEGSQGPNKTPTRYEPCRRDLNDWQQATASIYIPR